jgi:hypothetical protein
LGNFPQRAAAPAFPILDLVTALNFAALATPPLARPVISSGIASILYFACLHLSSDRLDIASIFFLPCLQKFKPIT